MQQSCDPRGFELVFADLATCTARLQLTCPIVAGAPGSGYTGNTVEACAGAMAATSCANFMNNVCNIVSGDLGTCDPPLADGAACPTPDFFFDRCQPPAMCTGNVCRLPDPSACGSADAGTD